MTTCVILSVALFSALGAALYPDAGGDCEACSGDSCKILEDVKLKKLCVEELCVDGNSVVVGDGDPCTSDDIVDGVPVHLPIKNCCANDEDCTAWAPALTCLINKCEFTDDEPNYGWCTFEPAPGCCAQAKDCPEQPCKTATCVPQEPDAPLLFSAQHKRFVPIHPTQVGEFPGTCNYTQIADCCLTSDECKGKCKGGTFGICDKAMKCMCVPSTDFECTVDSDCEKDTNAKDQCEKGCEGKPPCYFYECDRGWCSCVFDPERDYDNDDVCCKDDCDDRDPTVQGKILCPDGNITEINFDGDDFYRCGTPVIETCNSTCPNGALPVDRNVTVDMNGMLVIKFDCDCCDRNSSGLDQPVFCKKDANGDGVNAPSMNCSQSENFDECTKCYDELCVLQPETGKANSTASLDELCEDAKGPGYTSFIPPPFPTPEEGSTCDFCDNVTEATSLTPTLLCALEYNVTVDPGMYSVCPKSFPIGADPADLISIDLESCCKSILATPAFDDNKHPNFTMIFECCEKLRDDGYPENPTCNECAGFGIFPATCDQCSCPNEWPSPCTFDDPSNRVVDCVPDFDNDQYYNCTDIRKLCTMVPGNGIDFEVENMLCAEKFGSNFTSLDFALQGNPQGEVQGTFCDCDDEIPDAFQLIVCGTDEDADGSLQCKNQPKCVDGVRQADEPVCMQICAAACPADKPPITTDNCVPPRPSVQKKPKLADVKAAAQAHGWFPRGPAGAKLKRQPELPPPRDDKTCEEQQMCLNCDCCDEDALAYPNSPFGTAVLNKCGNYDMNCDCMYHATVACNGSVSEITNPDYYNLGDIGENPSDGDDFAIGIRLLGSTTAPKYANETVAPTGITISLDRSGYCGDDCDNMCMNYTTGFLIESKHGGPGDRKRLSIQLQKSCVELVDVLPGMVDANGNSNDLLPGQCFEFLEACSAPCVNENCNPDCEICTKLWS